MSKVLLIQAKAAGEESGIEQNACVVFLTPEVVSRITWRIRLAQKARQDDPEFFAAEYMPGGGEFVRLTDVIDKLHLLESTLNRPDVPADEQAEAERLLDALTAFDNDLYSEPEPIVLDDKFDLIRAALADDVNAGLTPLDCHSVHFMGEGSVQWEALSEPGDVPIKSYPVEESVFINVANAFRGI